MVYWSVATNPKKLYQISLKRNAPISAVNKYKEYRNLLNKLKRKCKITYYKYYKYKCEEYRTNVKKLWQVINTCLLSNKLIKLTI